jgi:hypothetical protein
MTGKLPPAEPAVAVRAVPTEDWPAGARTAAARRPERTCPSR